MKKAVSGVDRRRFGKNRAQRVSKYVVRTNKIRYELSRSLRIGKDLWWRLVIRAVQLLLVGTVCDALLLRFGCRMDCVSAHRIAAHVDAREMNKWRVTYARLSSVQLYL